MKAQLLMPIKKNAHLLRGEFAENQALQFLLNAGLVLVEKNFRCKVGEIDLIMREKDALVITEVRYRKSDRFGSAAESVTASKQSRIIAATHYYLSLKPHHKAIRFDVVAISGDNHINWIKNAF